MRPETRISPSPRGSNGLALLRAAGFAAGLAVAMSLAGPAAAPERSLASEPVQHVEPHVDPRPPRIRQRRQKAPLLEPPRCPALTPGRTPASRSYPQNQSCSTSPSQGVLPASGGVSGSPRRDVWMSSRHHAPAIAIGRCLRGDAVYSPAPRRPSIMRSRLALNGLPSYQFGQPSPPASSRPTPYRSSRSCMVPSSFQVAASYSSRGLW